MEYSILTGARVLVSMDGNRTLAVDMGDGSPVVPITPPVLDLHVLGFEPLDVENGTPQHVEMDTAEIMDMIRHGPVILRGNVQFSETFILQTDTVATGAFGRDVETAEEMCLFTIPMYFNKVYHIALVIYPDTIYASVQQPNS